MIVVLGDLHIRKEEAFLKAYEMFFDWMVEQDWNAPENTLIQLGDWFHFDKPSPLAYEIVMRALKRFRFKEIIVLGGNHDYRRQDSSFTFYPFKDFLNIRYMTIPDVYRIEDFTCMFLPFMYLSAKQQLEENYYQIWIKKLAFQAGTPIDYTFHHLATEKQSFQAKPDIESKYLLGKVIGGHIHIKSDDYIGVPFPTRADEAGQKGRIILINQDREEIEEDVPRFLDYSSVVFGEDPEINKEGVTLLNIFDAPSKQEAMNKYGDHYINRIELFLTSLSDGQEIEIDLNKSNKELFTDFVKEKKLNRIVAEKIQDVL